ncbi:MAG TPA: DUF4394 domain-containing protein [Mycobacteriales bacterium]|nr:DUF4394 domain-containing protein [Mycobacteriales bacterium]
MRTRARSLVAAGAGVLAAAALGSTLVSAAPAAAAPGDGLQAVALAGQGQRLIGFSTATPGQNFGIGRITGLVGDTKLVGIDYRVLDGKLYGVGNQGGVYTVNDMTAAATRTSNPALPLDGSVAYGIDVNPAADALRVISAKGQNLRLPLAVAGSAATVDTPLTRPVVPTTNPPTSEPALGLTAAAYTNNDVDTTTGTTLFDIDTSRDQVTIQAPANGGTTAATGALGVDFGVVTGFDIYAKLTNGKAGALRSFAVSNDTLYSIDLLSGAATSAGSVRDKTTTDFALRLVQG